MGPGQAGASAAGHSTGNILAWASAGAGLILLLAFAAFLLAPKSRELTSALTQMITRPSKAGSTLLGADSRDGAGTILAGQYEIIRTLGVGGMGRVYEARDLVLGRSVAIKQMREELRQDPKQKERFLAEARMVAALHHPNIVDIYSVIDDGNDVYLVFEYIEGKTVSQLLSDKGSLKLPETLSILRGVSMALDYAHEHNVIHRDLKPANIMVNSDGHVKVMDFGIARLAKNAALTQTIVGTPAYMSPEQEKGAVRPESDIYSLGVCLYEMLSGDLPAAAIFATVGTSSGADGLQPLLAQNGFKPGFEDILAQALSPNPDNRFRTAKDFVARLEAL
jgi:serine/threonine-protein kinase